MDNSIMRKRILTTVVSTGLLISTAPPGLPVTHHRHHRKHQHKRHMKTWKRVGIGAAGGAAIDALAAGGKGAGIGAIAGAGAGAI